MLANVEEINSAAMDEVERHILKSACSGTRCLYEIVPPHADNWVIRWLMWHVIESTRTSPMLHAHLTAGIRSPREDSMSPAHRVVKEVRFDVPAEGMLAKHMAFGACTKWLADDSAARTPSPQTDTARRGYWDPIRSP